MKKHDFKTSVLKGVNQTPKPQSLPTRPSLTELANKIEADGRQPAIEVQRPPRRESPQKTRPKSERQQPPVKDAFSCTKDDLKMLNNLIDRSRELGIRASKSEVLRAGILVLGSTSDAEFREILMNVPQIKTGRPAKKAKANDKDVDGEE